MFLTFVVSFPVPLMLLRKVFWNNMLGMVRCVFVCKQICVFKKRKKSVFMSETEPRRRQCEHYKILFGQFPRKIRSHENLGLTVGLKQKCQTSDGADSDLKKIRQELIACRLHSG